MSRVQTLFALARIAARVSVKAAVEILLQAGVDFRYACRYVLAYLRSLRHVPAVA